MLDLIPTRLHARRAFRKVPDPKVIGRLTPSEKAAFYKHAVRAAWEDGKLRFVERLYLDQLRRDLGLTEHEGQRIEEKAYASA